MKILLTADGSTVVAVYTDKLLPVASRLGEKDIARASEVEWVDGTWQAKSRVTGEVLASTPTRQEALQKEVEAIESDLTKYA